MTSEYEFYNLTMSLLISKDYCHHVLNNPEYLHKLRNFNCTFTSNTINLLKETQDHKEILKNLHAIRKISESLIREID